jgi:hypothetical protein
VLLTRCCAEELCDMAFLCTLMDDPVVASDGHTYNREEIQKWFKGHDTSPRTNEPFEHKILIPNMAMRQQIIAWREKHGLPIPSFGAPAKAQASGGGGGGGADAGQILKPAAVCGYSKQPLQVFCITCDKAICVSCAIDPARCQSHTMRQLASIVSSVRDVHAAWLQLREGRPHQLQAECDRVDAAAEAAHKAIREEAAELKVELQRACVGDLEGALEEQAQLLADVEVAAASPDAAVAGSEACRCLRAAATGGPRAPGEGDRGGRFEPVAAAVAAAGSAGGARARRLGWIVGAAAAAASAAGRAVGAGAVAADGLVEGQLHDLLKFLNGWLARRGGLYPGRVDGLYPGRVDEDNLLAGVEIFLSDAQVRSIDAFQQWLPLSSGYSLSNLDKFDDVYLRFLCLLKHDGIIMEQIRLFHSHRAAAASSQPAPTVTETMPPPCNPQLQEQRRHSSSSRPLPVAPSSSQFPQEQRQH